MQDVVSDINAHGLGGALLSLYQKKAFDHVDWDYLLQVLERTNFGESFRNWISLFYTHISSVLVNGEHSDYFYVSHGVRQGCPFPPLFYVLMAKTLACTICAEPLIVGSCLPGNKRVMIRQHAFNIETTKANNTTTVILDRVPYGLPEASLTNSLARYREIKSLRPVTHKVYYCEPAMEVTEKQSSDISPLPSDTPNTDPPDGHHNHARNNYCRPAFSIRLMPFHPLTGWKFH